MWNIVMWYILFWSVIQAEFDNDLCVVCYNCSHTPPCWHLCISPAFPFDLYSCPFFVPYLHVYVHTHLHLHIRITKYYTITLSASGHLSKYSSVVQLTSTSRIILPWRQLIISQGQWALFPKILAKPSNSLAAYPGHTGTPTTTGMIYQRWSGQCCPHQLVYHPIHW